MEKDVTPIATPEIDEVTTIWNSYMQSCCESGQLYIMMGQLESQKAELEKKYEVTNAKSKSLLFKYNQAKQNGAKHNPDLTPKTEAPQAGALQ